MNSVNGKRILPGRTSLQSKGIKRKSTCHRGEGHKLGLTRQRNNEKPRRMRGNKFGGREKRGSYQ